MCTKVDYVIKNPSVKDGLFAVYKVVEVSGYIESKELVFTSPRDKVVEVVLSLIRQQLQIQSLTIGGLIHVKSELLQQVPECFDEKIQGQEFLNFEGSLFRF